MDKEEISKYPVTLGLEEEVFVLESGRLLPTLQSLDVLRRLFWKAPRVYMTASASNFAKAEDRKECFMGSIEVTSGKHSDPELLVADILAKRRDLYRAANGALILPTGALFTTKSPSNTASSHIHVGVPVTHRERVYQNLAYFLPLLARYASNSPYAEGHPFPGSYRMASEGLLGSLREDNEYRFQDLIVSKRLGTIELRIFDPIPEPERLLELLKAVQAIAASSERFPFSRDGYNQDRSIWANGNEPDNWPQKKSELDAIYLLNQERLDRPFGDQLRKVTETDGIEAGYRFASNAWFKGDSDSKPATYHPVKAARGILGYYVLRLPFMAYKGYKEWYGKS